MLINDLTRLVACHPLFGREVDVFLRSEGNQKTCCYVADAQRPSQTKTRVDIEIDKDVCYLLHIEIHPQFRGKGMGARLYRMVEDFARAANCQRIEMTCSGWTPSGETRADWVARKLGYKITDEIIATKELRPKD